MTFPNMSRVPGPSTGETTEVADIPNIHQLYQSGFLARQEDDKAPEDSEGNTIEPSDKVNKVIGLIRASIASLEVDAIVNAANTTLLGGGGVDRVIHRGAGPNLVKECRTLHGCQTGDAKITGAYNLPCRKVIHTVGPVYDGDEPEEMQRLLTSCYTRSLEVAAENGCRTVAFSSISTGVYGYPSRAAASTAATAVRAFLEGPDGDKLDRVIFVVFEMKEVRAYNEVLTRVFPISDATAVTLTSPESED